MIEATLLYFLFRERETCLHSTVSGRALPRGLRRLRGGASAQRESCTLARDQHSKTCRAEEECKAKMCMP